MHGRKSMRENAITTNTKLKIIKRVMKGSEIRRDTITNTKLFENLRKSINVRPVISTRGAHRKDLLHPSPSEVQSPVAATISGDTPAKSNLTAPPIRKLWPSTWVSDALDQILVQKSMNLYFVMCSQRPSAVT